MSNNFPGGWVTKSPPVVSTSSAPGMWTLAEQAAYQKTGNWPIVVPPVVGWAGAFTTGDTTRYYGSNFDSSGNILNWGFNSTTSEVMVQKLDVTDGSEIWVKSFSSAQGTLAATGLNTNGEFVFADSSDNVYLYYTWTYNGGGIIKLNSSGTYQASRYSRPGFLYAGLNAGFDGTNLKVASTYLSTNGYNDIHTLNTSLGSTSNTRRQGSGAQGAFSGYLSPAGNWWQNGQLGNGTNDTFISKDLDWYRVTISGETG